MAIKTLANKSSLFYFFFHILNVILVSFNLKKLIKKVTEQNHYST
uniref:Uncharacterized protein n=1 Tax=Rhizophora mucronata TaxID=61149 RepID=A0A2P2L675_RHIMU